MPRRSSELEVDASRSWRSGRGSRWEAEPGQPPKSTSSSIAREGVQLGEEPGYTAYRYRRPEEPPLILSASLSRTASGSSARREKGPLFSTRSMLDETLGTKPAGADHHSGRVDRDDEYRSGQGHPYPRHRGGRRARGDADEDESDDRDLPRRRERWSPHAYQSHSVSGDRPSTSSRTEALNADVWEDGPPQRLATPLPFGSSAGEGDSRDGRERYPRQPELLLDRFSSGRQRWPQPDRPLQHSTLWVRELEPDMTPEGFRAYFEELVPVANVKLPMPRPGIPPFGFVKCVHLSDAERLLELQEMEPSDHFYMNGRKILLRPGKMDLDDPDSSSRPQRRSGIPRSTDRHEGGRKIFVAGLELHSGRDQNAAIDEVGALFRRYGRLEHVSVPSRALEPGMDPFAFVTFETHYEASQALQGLRAEGLKVRWYVTENDGNRPPSPGTSRYDPSADPASPDRRDHKRTFSGHDVYHAAKRLKTEPTAGVFVRGPFRSASSRTLRDLEQDLDDLFSPFGRLVFTSVPNKSLTAAQARGENALFGFVRFEQIDDAQAALERMDGQQMEGGGRLVVKYDENARLDVANAQLQHAQDPKTPQVDVRPALPVASDAGLDFRDSDATEPAPVSPGLGVTEHLFVTAATSRQSTPKPPVLVPSKRSPSIDVEDPSSLGLRTPTHPAVMQTTPLANSPPAQIGDPRQGGTPDRAGVDADADNENVDDELAGTAFRRFPLPDHCLTSHPDHVKHRKAFRFQTIRHLGSTGITVLDAEYDADHLILTIVAEAPSRGSSHPVHDVQQSIYGTTTSSSLSSHLGVSGGPASANLDAVAAVDPLFRPKFLFSQPEYAFIDDPAGELRETLSTFLAVYFRFWEESRAELCTLYDTTAVFSNVLSKQGCRPQGVTKQNTWPSILATISRLPALSHDDSMDDWVVDAWLYPAPDGDRAFCVVHGSFTEFPKKTQRAFDRTFILRPADPRSIAHVRHGVRWVILSDLLMIRKFTVKAGSLVREMRSPGPTDFFEGDTARHVQSPPSMHSVSMGSEPPESRITIGTTSTHSSRDLGGPTSTMPLLVDDRLTGAGPNMAIIAGQLAALQAEVEKLKAAQVRGQVGSGSDTSLSSPAPSRHDPVRSEGSPPAAQVTTTGNFSHRGLGAKKRLLLRADGPGAYFALSFRGDVVAFQDGVGEPKDKVQLVQSAPSTSHTVDGAIYSDIHAALVVGYFGDKDTPPSCQVSVTKVTRGPKGVAAPNREMLTARPHDRGVVSMCLLSDAAQRDSLAFATAGHDRKIVVWRTFGDYTETQSFRTAHTNAIQGLELDASREWILSAGRDKKFMAHDLQTQEPTFNVKELGLLSQIVMNPDQPHTATLVAADSPNAHFRIYDLRRASRPIQTFGMPLAPGRVESANLSVYRKGASRSNTFAFAGTDTDGNDRGVRIWDLRNLKTSVLDIGKSVALQPWFENSSKITVLGREDITFASLVV